MTTRALEDEVRETQLALLKNITDRLMRGDPPLPTDVMGMLVDEIELRIDGEAVSEAWTEEGGDGPPEPPTSRRVPVGVHDVIFLKRATRDIEALGALERGAVADCLSALSTDPLPRGARALHGPAARHVQHRAGRHRVLYCLHERTITVVAVTTGPP